MRRSLSRPLRALAVGRIVLGVASIAFPDRLARLSGAPAMPELAYLTRIFGARAIALGTVALTGTYAAIGAGRLANDLR